MKKSGSAHVYLDITLKDREHLTNRFPNIYRTCAGYGIDISKDYIPVAPAEHYCMGGIKTDVFGRTDIKGFYACGEAACTGIHGANRLASNSLLEGLVFGHKIGEEVSSFLKNNKKKAHRFSLKYRTDRKDADISKGLIKSEIRGIMTQKAGIIRDRQGLSSALRELNRRNDNVRDMENITIEDFELQNMLLLSKLVTEAALEREESRGAHYRADFPQPDDKGWKRHIIKTGNIKQ
jgi:L-aspartate oxidase